MWELNGQTDCMVDQVIVNILEETTSSRPDFDSAQKASTPCLRRTEILIPEVNMQLSLRFENIMVVQIVVQVTNVCTLWVGTNISGTYGLHLQPCRWGGYVPLKQWYPLSGRWREYIPVKHLQPPTGLQGMTQKTTV